MSWWFHMCCGWPVNFGTSVVDMKVLNEDINKLYLLSFLIKSFKKLQYEKSFQVLKSLGSFSQFMTEKFFILSDTRTRWGWHWNFSSCSTSFSWHERENFRDAFTQKHSPACLSKSKATAIYEKINSKFISHFLFTAELCSFTFSISLLRNFFVVSCSLSFLVRSC